jgi:hypothetical protein
MPQIFHPAMNTVARGILIGLPLVSILGGVGLAYGITASPWMSLQHVTQEQPVPFSHEHHVNGLGLDCRYCHTSVTESPFAGIPPTKTCMTCHSKIWTNAELLAPVRESFATQVPIQWVRVHDLPDYVYFDHSIHVAKGVGCEECHGHVEQMPLMRKVASLQMSWCLECHRAPESHLRPREEVFNMTWQPPEDREALGRKLVAEYHIQKEQLTNCSICHR